MCSYDPDAKAAFVRCLGERSILACQVETNLGQDSGGNKPVAKTVGVHFDRTVPANESCLDIWTEVFLMACCRGLFATRSNIAGLVASLSMDP